VDALKIQTAVSAVTGKWFSAIRTLTTQRLSSPTCGTLTSQALTVGVACTSLKEKTESIQPTARKSRAQKKKNQPTPIPSGAKLLRLPAPGQSPQPEQLAKDAPKRVPHNAVQITYEYSPTQKVVRYEWLDATNPKGRSKTYSQFHIDPDGKKVWTKGDAPWPAYRMDEVIELLKTVPDAEPIIILMPEGEHNVDIARSIGIAGLTLQGSEWSDREIQKMLEALRATGKNVSIAKLAR
jgi:putative DNA primase/helicase